jgi:predicted phage terminase large subunit-like protein
LPDSWLSDLLSWWIDQETGYAIAEHSGIVRWFVRAGGDLAWADSREELIEEYPRSQPKSLTFIPASVYDNKILLERDPGYIANLMALPYVERERLAHGNWKVIAAAGNVFQRGWFNIVDVAPAGISWVRFWDLAATEKKSQSGDPDWTAGARLGLHEGRYYIGHVTRSRSSWHDVKKLIVQTAALDGKGTAIGVEQEPGASGKSVVAEIVAMPDLVGYTVRGLPPWGDKVVRANPWAAQAQAGNVYLVRGSWDMQGFLDECEMFPDGPHDDRVDAVSGCVRMLGEKKPKPAQAQKEISAEDYRQAGRGLQRRRTG